MWEFGNLGRRVLKGRHVISPAVSAWGSQAREKVPKGRLKPGVPQSLPRIGLCGTVLACPVLPEAQSAEALSLSKGKSKGLAREVLPE